jgi:hypothetical protein
LKDEFTEPHRGYTYQVNYKKFIDVINFEGEKSTLKEHKISLSPSAGDVVIHQNTTDLGPVHAEFKIPSTKDMKKGK